MPVSHIANSGISVDCKQLLFLVSCPLFGVSSHMILNPADVNIGER